MNAWVLVCGCGAVSQCSPRECSNFQAMKNNIQKVFAFRNVDKYLWGQTMTLDLGGCLVLAQ